MKRHQQNLPPDRFRDNAAIGLRVFPVLPRDKKPAGAWRGYQTEAPNAEELKAWDQSGYNVGVVTGAASGIVAEVLSITIKTLRRWRWTRKGRCHLVDLDRYVQSNRVENSQ